ncbi:DUF2339 domain-containing protein [Legionella qingyii]|uniref:DUF2339 domain-containing protein n=1 Tax=Legionella qingyii TaxID=2184757 RepID=A0A317U590_9GAMM|nr:DUF2339 domain-containing protein [Legionella qingyii]PWY55642.1 DUF2339 domain-containing protein [Legionella qingyii]RUR21763.1 DUF2339 domain-containing protein [Legionella qingyii]RUR25309.1 DUF2339 domain-containing protein [Legionella qingyii]
MDTIDIEQCLHALEARVSKVEKINGITSASSEQSKSIKSKKSKLKSIPKPMSGNWLGLVASVCFILAACFIVKLSIESGWLTHEKQLGVATLFGMALFTGGIIISSADRIYACFLPAAGATVLYLTCFAAFQYYLLISFQTLIALSTIISGVSIWFYLRFKHDIYAIVAALGAYIAPLVAGVENNAIFSLYYFTICSLNFATLAIWVESRTLTMISAYLAISITAVVGLKLHQDVLIATVLVINFLIYSIGTLFHTQLTKKHLTEKESWSLFPVLLIFYAMEYYYLSRIDPTLASCVSLASAALLVGLYYSAKRWFPERRFNSRNVLLTFVTLVCFHSIYLGLLPLSLKPWLFAVIVFGYAYFHAKIKLIQWSIRFLIPFVALSAILGIEYLSILSHLISSNELSWSVVAGAAFASIWFLLIQNYKELAQKEEYCYVLLAASHLLAIMSLYQLTIEYSTLAVSASWLAYVLIILRVSTLRNDVLIAKSVLIVLFFAAGKALLYDASSAPTIIRTLSLILTGIVLYASGLVIRKKTNWKGKLI